MRTNIEIDDALMSKAMAASHETTKRAVVEAGLRLLVHMQEQTEIRKWRGKIAWEGDLEESRQDRYSDRSKD
jgi:Arc/MetJ family transcription regulator